MPYALPSEALNQLSVEIDDVVASATPPARYVLVESPALRVVLLALPAGHQTSSHIHPTPTRPFTSWMDESTS